MSSQPRQLVRDATHIVRDMLDGIVATHPHLVLVRGENVLLHREFERIRTQQVTLLSGGGSGHEPAHAGYIGDNMLTGVVCGNVFASPSTKQVLAAIRLATGPHGCLVIVKNYTGDRINFGLAVEQAKAEGLNVDMVVVGEDVAVVNAHAGRRGLSGTVFVHKLAGAAAASGRSLAELVAMVDTLTTTNRLGTMGVAIAPCTLPGQRLNDDNNARSLGENEVEVGLGIHGEPGIEKRTLEDLPTLTDSLLARILDGSSSSNVHLNATRGAGVVLMVNNLGTTTTMELYVVAKYAIAALKRRNLVVERVFVGSFMTALDMAGFSLSLWLSDRNNELLDYLDTSTTAPGWTCSRYIPSEDGVDATTNVIEPVAAPSTDSTSASKRPTAPLSSSALTLERAIHAACTALIQHEPELTRWDAAVGDGDCGTTFQHAAERILEDMETHYPLEDAAQTLRQVALSIAASAGGTSGVLYDILFTAAAHAMDAAQATDKPIVAAWTAAFHAGVAAVQKYGGAREGARTMLDALLPAVRALGDPTTDTDSVALLAAAAKAADAGADATKDIPTSQAFGRTGYVGEAFAAGVPDPGAKAAAFWLAAVARAVAPQ